MSIQKNKFKAIVKPNSEKSKIESFDANSNTYRIHLKAKPEYNKANIELIKLLSKHLKKKIRISSGFKSKEKIIEIVE